MKALKIAVLVLVVLLFAKICWSSVEILPAQELGTIQKVAKEYRLSDWQTKLLISIRKAENGKTPVEFGVLVPEAMRFSNDPVKSFETQARWTAGSIKKRCQGAESLESFSLRWCPLNAKNDPSNLNKNFLKNVRYWLDVQEKD